MQQESWKYYCSNFPCISLTHPYTPEQNYSKHTEAVHTLSLYSLQWTPGKKKYKRNIEKKKKGKKILPSKKSLLASGDPKRI